MLVLAIVALEVPLARSVADRVEAEVRSQARGQADVVAASVADVLGPGRARERRRLVEAAAANVRGRVIVVDADGALLADSEGAPARRSYADRPEIVRALSGRPDQRERRSETLGQRLLATSVPVFAAGRPVGAVRITQSVDAVDRAVRRSWIGLALIGLLVLGLGLAVGAVVARQIARPLGRLDAAARRFGEGDLDARAEVEGSAEQRSLAATFNDMTARIRGLLVSQREFVADASHQLRTPLTGLRLRVEAARADVADPEVARELDAALVELDRLARMIDELLELSRAGEREAEGGRIPLARLVTEAAERWQPAAVDRGRQVRALVEDPDACAFLSRADADRIVDALVENALNYSAGGTAVELAAQSGGFAVRDRGPGVDPDERDAVFERFHRGRTGRGEKGTGLGLPIARELARRWGGDVTLHARPGGGTVAEVRLPPA